MTSVKLSKRLKAIADFVDENATVADIGCDHALLDIYLSQHKVIKKAIACDITEGALNQARRNVSINNIKNIDIRLSDGLTCIKKEDKINTIVMSGLGDQKIINIIKNDIDKISCVSSIIIQSNVGVSNIRKFFTSINYYIENEVLVKERNIIYTVIKFVKGNKKYTKKELTYGPVLLKEKSSLFKELLNEEINKNNYIIKKLSLKNIPKKIKLIINNIMIRRLF